MSPSVLHLPADLVISLLPQGFARIVQPIASTTITTDTNGLTAGEVKIQTMTGPVPAYRAHPEKSGPTSLGAPRGPRAIAGSCP